MAGVRYRARRLSATLLPTVPVHAPLVFELIDCWKERSIGQCTYFVGHPHGFVYSARPTNATEAEARRTERFQVNTPLSGPVTAPPDETNPSFPGTLDLRVPPPVQKTPRPIA